MASHHPLSLFLLCSRTPSPNISSDSHLHPRPLLSNPQRNYPQPPILNSYLTFPFSNYFNIFTSHLLATLVPIPYPLPKPPFPTPTTLSLPSLTTSLSPIFMYITTCSIMLPPVCSYHTHPRTTRSIRIYKKQNRTYY